jgi:hypothetical protein
MEHKGKMGANIICNVERPAILKPRCLVQSIYDVEHWREGELLSKTQDTNMVTNQGLDFLLDCVFGAKAKVTTAWYVLIFESDTTILATHTYAVPGFTESSAYDEGARVEYVDVAASSQSLTNSASKAVFTIDASKTIYGAALVGATAGDITVISNTDATNGILYCASQFGSAKSVVDNDVLNVTITLTAADV